MLRSVSKSLLPKLVVVAVIYYAIVRLGIDAIPSTQLWPASGIALAALLRWGPYMLLPLVPAHLLAVLAAGLLPGAALAATAVSALQVVGTAWLLARMRFDRSFASPRDVVAFTLVAVVAAPALSAAVGSTALGAIGELAWIEVPTVLRRWWIGHAVGALVVVPILVLAGPGRGALRAAGRRTEAALATGALLLVCLAVFGPWPGLGAARQPISFVVFPVVAWAAYRFGPTGAAGANLLVAVFAVWGMLGGSGPFGRESRDQAVFVTWAFLAVTSLASLALASLVAARDRTERELRHASDALRALEAATRAGSWIWRPDARLHLGSPRQRELHGLADHGNPIPEELLLERIHADDRRRVLQEFEAAWRSRGRIETEYRVVLPDGSVRWLATSGACLPVDPARPSGPLQMVGVHVDVSARKQLEAGVRRGDRLASLGTFAAGVAHELNNPLGTILLAAEEARACVHDSEVTARALDDIADDAKRAARIVRSVLRFAKEEPTERSRVDLRHCVERALARTRSYCGERGVGLELRSAPLPLEILANATQIEQLVQNLVSNAVEACDRDSRIRVEVDLDGAEVTLTVADEGRGMTSTEIEHAFDPFYTTRSREGGSGLGLSICHGIVQAHDGGIEIESAPGYGTRVRVRLPRAAADPGGAMGASDGPAARGR